MWGPSSQARGTMSPALEGKVLTTGPPGKSLGKLLKAGHRLNATIPGSTALCQPSHDSSHSLRHAEGTTGFPCWLSSKESAWQCRRHGFNPWGRKWNPLQYFCLGNPLDRGAQRCRVRELENVRLGKRTRLALYRNRSPLMRREGAAVRLVSCYANPRRHICGNLLS